MSMISETGFRRLLVEEVSDAERAAPPVDPLSRMRHVQEQRARRKACAVSLAFVVFVLAVQALPRSAVGATPSPAIARAAMGQSNAAADHLG